MLIPKKYELKPGNTPETGSVQCMCKFCGTKFMIPPSEITEELMKATVCEDPKCVESLAAEEKAKAEAKAKEAGNADAASTIAKALGK